MPTLPVFLPTRDQLDVVLAGQLGGAVEAAVGEDDDPVRSSRSPRAAAAPARPPRRPGSGRRRRDRVERLAQRALVVGQCRRRPAAGPRGDDRQLVAEPQAVDQPAALGLGRLQPARRHVVGVHARRVVDDQHHPPRPGLLPAEDRVGQGEDQQAPGTQAATAARAGAAAAARATAASSPRRSAARRAASRPAPAAAGSSGCRRPRSAPPGRPAAARSG